VETGLPTARPRVTLSLNTILKGDYEYNF